ELRLSVLHGLLLKRRIDTREQLTFLYLVVEVDEDLGDLTRDLRADLHGANRTQLAGGGHRRLERRPLDGRGAICRTLASFRASIEPGRAAKHCARNCGRRNFDFVHCCLVDVARRSRVGVERSAPECCLPALVIRRNTAVIAPPDVLTCMPALRDA